MDNKRRHKYSSIHIATVIQETEEDIGWEGEEVWRKCVGSNTWCTPIICNNVIYHPGSRSNLFATIPNFADEQFVKMYTLDGI